MAKVPAQAIASMTAKGAGISSSIPKALKIARAASAKTMPTSAQTIQDGKYDPRILREGAPSHPASKLKTGAARQTRAAGGKRQNAPPRSGELVAIFMRRQCHRFIRREQSPLWGRPTSVSVGLLPWIVKKCTNAVEQRLAGAGIVSANSHDTI